MARERLDRGDAAHLPPSRSVIGGCEVGVVVGAEVEGGKPGAIGEDDVVGSEALFGESGRGDHEDWAGAEAKEEDRAVLCRESGQVLVEGFL